ncbi:SWIM zinc finger family protein [Mucilaginibacter sp. CSA2-8R]|uniref:SWIM zinc finger family protein n=1 Tax=Mucilaginibacter sp. CSA2-8R TaxID=3141542 RepID=UPI00315CEA62
MQLTEDQIFSLAPDEASKKAGRDLATPAKWVSLGVSAQALWGECKGSGSKPYQTQVDLTNVAFKCSCPSRKFPCKHGLGLLLLNSRQPGLFQTANMPGWVSDWLSKRSEKEEKKAEKAEKPVDENALAKRQQAREQKVNAGIQELLMWIKDIVRNGIISLPEKGAAFWENMARRMVDAQAPGLAAMVRQLAATPFWNEGWQSSFMDNLLQIYLVTEGYQHIGNMNPDLQADIRAAIGFTVNQDELRQQEGIHDNWLVLGKEVREEQQLSVEENWLYGIQSGQYALFLQFSARGQVNQVSLMPGSYIKAELVYFPSAVPYRCLIKNHTVINPPQSVAHRACTTWPQVAEYEAMLNTKLPFGNTMPIVVADLKPVQFQKQWWLQDNQGYLCKIADGFKSIYKLLALSGGEALPMAVIGKENVYRPLGVWYQNTYQFLG